MNGLYLAEPHGLLVWEGKKTAIIKGSPDPDLSGTHLFCSGGSSAGKAYGRIEVGKGVPIALEDFDAQFDSHRVTAKEREQWWLGVDPLYSYPIISFERLNSPRPVVVPNGVGTLMGEVQFKEELPDNIDNMEGNAMPYSKLSEANPAIRGIDPPVTLAQANLIAKMADGIERAGTADDPWAAAIGKFERDYRVEGGRWVKKKTKEVTVRVGDEIATISFESVPDALVDDKAAADQCVCPECGETVERKRDTSCTKLKCPECGERMEQAAGEGEGEDENESKEFDLSEIGDAIAFKVVEELKGTAEENNLPDSAFLYVEPGEKDESGKTVPRSKRHLRYREADGSLDLPHLRNALSRLGQPKTGSAGGERWLSESLRNRLRAKAERLLAGATGKTEKKDLVESVTDAIREGFRSVREFIAGPQLPTHSFDNGAPRVGFKVVEHGDEDYLVTWTTNAFEDREKELFATKALEEYVARHANEKIKGAFLYRHWPATKFGDIKAQSVYGRFLVEVGTFDDTSTGCAFRQLFKDYPDGHPTVSPEGWGCSHGFVYDADDRRDGTYEWFDKKETSVLPLRIAANPYTFTEVMSMTKEMNTDEITTLLGEEEAKHIKRVAEIASGMLEKVVRSKEEAPSETPPAEETPAKSEKPKPAEETPVEETLTETPVETVEDKALAPLVKAVTEGVVSQLHLDDLSKALESISAKLGEQDERLKQLESDDVARREEAEKSLPRYGGFRPSWMPSDEKATKPVPSFPTGTSLTEVASQIADRILGSQ